MKEENRMVCHLKDRKKLDMYDILNQIKEDGLTVEGTNDSVRLTHPLLEEDLSKKLNSYSKSEDTIQIAQDTAIQIESALFTSALSLLRATMKKHPEESREYQAVKGIAEHFLRTGKSIRLGKYDRVVDVLHVRYRERQENKGVLPEKSVQEYLSGARYI